MMELNEVYQVGTSKKVKEVETELVHELTELRTELEEVDLPAKMTSSVPIPENKEHFLQERKHVIKRALQVSEAQPVKIQAEEMKLEMDASQDKEYTLGSLPLLVHQYFTDRIQQIVLSKHQHMLRWKRFCEHTSTLESLKPIYSQRLVNLLNEYKDCVQRSQRMASVREALFLNRPESAVQVLNQEDLLIYLRWLVCHLHSMKRFNQYLKVLQWLPFTHKLDISPPDLDEEEKEELTHASKIASRYQDDIFNQGVPGSSRPTSGRSGRRVFSPVPSPPPINPALLSTGTLPASAMLYAAAAAGGGLASDEQLLSLPIHSMDFNSLQPQLAFFLNIYAYQFDLSKVRNSADEMEMFGIINQRFRSIFSKQEQLNTFKTYDRTEPGQDSADAPNYTMKKEANWLKFIALVPEPDPQQEKMWTQLHQSKRTDEILRVLSHFIKVSSSEKVQDTLKEHAVMVRNPQPVSTASVSTHRTPNNTIATWRKIYSKPELYTEAEQDDNVSLPDIDEREIENVQFKSSSRAGSAHKRKDSYDYVSTMQMLGLDEGEEQKSDPVTAQGAYLSYLHLRHLRIRDLQRSCLSILNYFRSIERTLTINDIGLSAEGDNLRQFSNQNHRVGTDLDGTSGGGGGLGDHGYVHNTPADFKMSESEFIEFSEVENHDDFYTIEEGRVQVLDQKGYNIMYNASLDDFKLLEERLLLISSHYVEKDRDLRSASRLKGSGAERSHQAGDFHIPAYAHQDVDRYGVLMDIWTNQAAFLECKRELLDCYYEAYQHVCDRDERRNLAQVITNIVNQKPRFDLTANYFVRTYRAECSLLRLQTVLVKSVLDKQIEQQREFTQRVTREGDAEFGLPKSIIPKLPISVNLSRPALKNVYMLEYHPTLAIASRIPAALKYAYWELYEIHRPASAYSALMMEKKLLQVALKEWESLPFMGTNFSMQVQKDLFSDVFAEDPLFQCELAQHTVTKQEQEAGRRTHKEKQVAMVTTIARLIETLNLRHRLIEVAWETEILSKVYKKQAADMGYPDFHMNMRFVQFEFASFKDKAGKPPPIFITAVQEDDAAVDKYTPSCLHLAIHELDEGHVGRFCFRSRDGLLQMLKPGSMESFQVVLKTQILHKNSLIAAIQQASICHPVKVTEWKSGRASPTETKSEKSSMTQMTGVSSATAATALGGKMNADPGKVRKAPESFFSLQLEKTPSRDLMLNDFVQKKQMMGTLLRNPEELEKVKRKLLAEFCTRFHQRMSHTSMRGQIIAYYNSILNLLSDFASIRETYFVMGEPNEKKSAEDDLEGLTADPRELKKRPRRLLSSDGSHVLNIWFIPHYTEALVLFKALEDETCARALAFSLTIIAQLHDLLQYLCAHARLGSSHARLGSQKMEFVSADWGGSEGIGSELREIQKQIQNLPDPTDPQSVVDLLTLRRDVMFLEFDTAVRNSMADTFLSTGNLQAYESIVHNASYGLSALSNVQRPSLTATYFNVPEPLEAKDLKAKKLFPWRSYLGGSGPFPCSFLQWFRIEQYIGLCLAGLRDVDRHVANGEILGVTLLMEDVLQTGFLGAQFHGDLDSQGQTPAESQADLTVSSQGQGSRSHSVSSDLREASKALAQSQSHSLSRTLQPIEAYRLLRFFLLLWKSLEVLKMDWGRRKLGVEKIDTGYLYREYCKSYRSEILLPVLQSVARRLGQGDLYDNLILDTDVYVMPKGASEIEVRVKQLIKLLESLECHMVSEVRKRVSKELTLAVAERAREEEALPTDLWKRSVMKESFTMNRPHIAEAFINRMMSEAKETEADVTLSNDHLQKCFAELARTVMSRERNAFDSYSMYYENLLRVHHQLLYTREQEIGHLKDQLKHAQTDTNVTVQCEMANQAHDLLMEITALRAKIAEMREMSLTQERDIRERVREEYNDLIQNIFNSTFQLRSKFDEFRNDLQDDVFDKINDTRGEAVAAMSNLQQKFMGTSDDEDLKANLSRAEQIRKLQNENHHLSQLILKMKAMSSWRQNVKTNSFIKTTTDLRKKAEGSKKDHLEVSMLAEEEVILLRQQLVAIRKALTATDTESNEVRKLLQKELKQKSEREHEEAQRQRSKQQLEQAKQASVERLVDELMDKQSKLRLLEEEQDRSLKTTQMNYEKTKRDADIIKRQLSHERNLKLDAFQRVDTLQTQVYDYESCLLNRPSSMVTPSSTVPRSRATSAQLSKRSRPSTGGGNWPPAVTWPANRSITPMGELPIDANAPLNNDMKKIQRPKTVGGRLRSRIAEQLLNELEPDTHRTIVQLEQLQNGAKRDRY